MQRKWILGLVATFFSAGVFSVPHEIVIVRHADKWLQKNPGPYLSPRGQVRAEKLTVYYLNKFGKPDFIFAAQPAPFSDSTESHSYRPLQTVLPLANALTFQNPHSVIVHTPYFEEEYGQLARQLLTEKKYAHKNIVICWQHQRINVLAHALGVTKKLLTWPNNVFDMVYVLQYQHGKLASFHILKHQYPMHTNLTWMELAKRIP